MTSSNPFAVDRRGIVAIPRSAVRFNPPNRTNILADIEKAMAYIARGAFPQRVMVGAVPEREPVKPKRGDKVAVSVVVYVGKVNDDGTLALTSKRDMYAAPITLDECHPSRARLLDEYEPPYAGYHARLTGDEVRETPWKRGTVLRQETPGSPPHRFILLPSGHWLNLDTEVAFGFADFSEHDRVVVEYAPGK